MGSRLRGQPILFALVLAAPLWAVPVIAAVPATGQKQVAALPVPPPSTPGTAGTDARTRQTPQATNETVTQTSTELGQSPLDESFGPRRHDDWVRETRRQAWKDTRFDLQLRSYLLTRDRFDDSESEAWAAGGQFGLQTGYFRERFAVGATAYTSQRLHGPDDKDGSGLLAPGQHGYTVLGELYGEFLVNPTTRLSAGRRGIDTPYLNRNDSRMTPNTFESITLQGVHGGGDGQPEWRFGGGYFDEIKERNSDRFVSMATVAGAPEGVERGVYAVGGNYKSGDLSLGAVQYYSDDILGIFYAEGKYAIPLARGLRLQFALQYSDETSPGDDLLRGSDFSSRQWGAKAELGYRGALFTTAYTRAAGDADMQSPWGGYPGYTSVQVEDFNRAGESAWMLRAAYAFESMPGLSVYGLYVQGSDPASPSAFGKHEVDLNLQWSPPGGALEGLMLRLRYAHVSQDDPGDSTLDDLRVMVFYAPPSR